MIISRRIKRLSGKARCFPPIKLLSTSCWRFPDPWPAPSSAFIQQHGLPLLHQAAQHAKEKRLLLQGWKHDSGKREVVTYHQALQRAEIIGRYLPSDNKQSFVANLCTPGWEYISTLWSIWGNGHASVPLALTQTVEEMEHVLSDTSPKTIILGGGCQLDGSVPPSHRPPNEGALLEAATNVGLKDRIVKLQDIFLPEELNSSDHDLLNCQLGQSVRLDDPAVVMYTSGTTGKPKGVVSTHRNVYHQVTDLVSSWQWSANDRATHLLPLHHVHGVINVLSCAAYAGAELDFQKFQPDQLWQDWAEENNASSQPTLFMAVPTIYAKLLEAADSLPNEVIQSAVESTLQNMRLMVSGSAALPVSVLQRWRALTGHTLLERYGMTEMAMALSNPYEPASQRHAGHVGLPLPSVEQVRLVDSETGFVVEDPNTPGSLEVKGPNVFWKYLNRPDATEEAFTEDGFFQTGDVAEYNAELNSYRILGRASVDVLKVGGYKISALEIERVFLEHESMAEVVIVGVPDETWGDKVGMLCRLKSGCKDLTIDEIREWGQSRLSKYKLPTLLRAVEDIPKNAMGKVNKKILVDLFRDKHG